jgi:tryptophan synthase alpha chain
VLQAARQPDPGLTPRIPSQVAPTLRAPLILFTYYNPILRRGLEAFIADISAAGVGGLLIPDIPLEETVEARRLCAQYNLELVLLATPTTQQARMARIAEATGGFVYLVSVTGVTGVQAELQDRVQRLVAQLKEVTNKPIAVGFGVSRPEQAAQLAAWGADGVIVGSALVRALGEAPTPGASCALARHALRCRTDPTVCCPTQRRACRE